MHKKMLVKLIMYITKEDQIDVLNMSTRLYNCLRRNKIDTIGDLVDFPREQWLSLHNLGAKSFGELANIVDYAKMQLCTLAPSTEQSVAEESQHDDIILIEQTGLSNRAIHVLKSSQIIRRSQLLKLTYLDIEKLKNAGQKTVDEICSYIEGVKSGSIQLPIKKETVSKEPANFIDASIDSFDFSVRARNCLLRSGITTVAQLVLLTREDLMNIRNMGQKTVEEILGFIELIKDSDEFKALSVNDDNNSATTEISDEIIRKKILALYNEDNFAGFSFEDFKNKIDLTEYIDESRLKSVIGFMISSVDLEYVDYRCYRVYYKFKDYLEQIFDENDRDHIIVLKRLNGETLESIGREFDITRERVRQLSKKGFVKICKKHFDETGLFCFDETFYEYFYKTYSLNKADAERWFGIGSDLFHYFDVREIKNGKKDLSEALSDSKLHIGLRYRVKNYLNRNKLLINRTWVEKRRSAVEEYVIRNFCVDDVSFELFAHTFNSLLMSNKIPYDEKIYYTKDVLRTRKNHIADSEIALWKQNETIRYYDINGYDYTELLETLNLQSYENIELSTLKFMDDYPELMKKYDIRDQYELHNLLRKIIPEGRFPKLKFGRNPVISFGTFDRSAAVWNLILNNAPISFNDLAELVRKEYGFESGAIRWQDFSEYCDRGVYNVDYPIMSSRNKGILKTALKNDFYYIDEIKQIYSNIVPDADTNEINSYNLKSMGFVVLSRYAVQNHSSLDAYFKSLLTSQDDIDITPIRKRFAYVQAFSAVFNRLKHERAIFEIESNHIISRNKMELCGITSALIDSFCDNVYKFVEADSYFTIKSLREKGFSDVLFDLGISDWFYANLLEEDVRFSAGHIFSNKVLYKGDITVLITDFCTWIVNRHRKISSTELVSELVNVYGCIVECRSDVTHRLRGAKLLYDDVTDEFFALSQACDHET